MTNNERAKKLLEKYVRGKCTAEEQQVVEEWYSYQLEDDASGNLPSDFEFKNKEVLLYLQEKISSGVKVRKIRFWLAAASVLLILVAVSFFWPVKEQSNIGQTEFRKANLNSATYNQPVFELADGQVIILDSTQPEIIINLTSVSYGNGNKITNPSLLDPDGINRIITPRGKQFEVTLPDGSRVWLNASSSLAYSNKFLTGKREVILKGEAYFEIARDNNRPFKVVSSRQIVSVIGTHFNIKSYEDGEAVKTTLLEGSVQVETTSAKKVFLKPDEESILQNEKEGFTVKKVVAKDAIAWRDGYFIFNNASLNSVLNEFSRWYDFEIGEQMKQDKYEFGGKIDRSLPLEKALQILNIYGIEFKLKNNVLITIEK